MVTCEVHSWLFLFICAHMALVELLRVCHHLQNIKQNEVNAHSVCARSRLTHVGCTLRLPCEIKWFQLACTFEHFAHGLHVFHILSCDFAQATHTTSLSTIHLGANFLRNSPLHVIKKVNNSITMMHAVDVLSSEKKIVRKARWMWERKTCYGNRKSWPEHGNDLILFAKLLIKLHTNCVLVLLSGHWHLISRTLSSFLNQLSYSFSPC